MLKIVTITRRNRTHLLIMLYFQEIAEFLNLNYDRRSSDWCVGVVLQKTMIYIFPLLRFLDLCMPPLQVHVVSHQSVLSTGILLVQCT